jgi:hypothetical protein
MATKKKAEPESTGPGGDNLRAASSQYRTLAGLSDKDLGSPTDPAKHESSGGGDEESLHVTGPAKADVEDKTQTDEAKAVKKKKAE